MIETRFSFKYDDRHIVSDSVTAERDGDRDLRINLPERKSCVLIEYEITSDK